MTNKYRILWLDDDFGSAENPQFQDDVKMAEDYGLEVKGVTDYESFCEEIRNFGSYQAVVFDLRGMEKDQEVTGLVMLKAYKLVENKLPCFVYSANNKDEKFELVINEIDATGRSFNKGCGVEPLYEKILSVLDVNLHYYEGHQECLHLFNKGYLNAVNRSKMDELLKMYDAKDKSYAPYNHMRHILENMFESLLEIGLIDRSLKDKGFDAKMKYITRDVNKLRDSAGEIIMKDGKEQFDYTNPMVPFSICRREVKYVLSFLGDMANRYSHFLEDNPRYLKQGETMMEYNYLIQQSVYNAFFVAMKWFYGYMESIPQKKIL